VQLGLLDENSSATKSAPDAAWQITMQITPDGLLAQVTQEEQKDASCLVSIGLPASAIWRLAGCAGASEAHAALFATARINGSADLAEALSWISKRLRWDLEDDLAQFVGDIAARRLHQVGLALSSAQRQAFDNLCHNLFEYLADEKELLLRNDQLQSYYHGVDELRDRLALLEARVENISRQ